MTFTHALHCLDQLRQVAYLRHYNSSLVDETTGKVDYFKWWHIDHCVEVLRRYMTCHADSTPYTFDWVPGARIAVHPGTVHTYRSFDRMMDVSCFLFDYYCYYYYGEVFRELIHWGQNGSMSTKSTHRYGNM